MVVDAKYASIYLQGATELVELELKKLNSRGYSDEEIEREKARLNAAIAFVEREVLEDGIVHIDGKPMQINWDLN